MDRQWSMKLRHIEIFHAVYVTGSVSGGARALNVSQPTVSKVLKHAEDKLGFDLFHRTQGRLTSTEKGDLLFAEITPIFEKLGTLRTFTANLARDKAGHLRFAMTPAFGLEIAPNAIAKFSKNNPDITIEVETQHSEQVVKAVLARDADIGLVFDAPHIPGVISKTLTVTNLICVAPKGLISNPRGILNIKDIEPYPLITLNEKSILGRILNQKLSDAFAKPIDSRIVAETYHIAKRLARQGAGVAIIDSVTAFSGNLSALDFWNIDPVMSINIDVVTRINEPISPYGAEFLRTLQATFDSFADKSVL